jgi:hypothetical protein
MRPSGTDTIPTKIKKGVDNPFLLCYNNNREKRKGVIKMTPFDRKLTSNVYLTVVNAIDHKLMTKAEGIEFVRNNKYCNELVKKRVIRLIEIHYLGKK